MYQLPNINRFLLLLLHLSLPTYALPSDRDKTVYIVADSSTYYPKTGTNVFIGHVKVDQGTTHITADRLITKKNNRHKIQEATAYGTQGLAHYWTQPQRDGEWMHAHAKLIQFYPLQDQVILQHDATILQGKNSFQGPFIFYNIRQQTITVPPTKKGRAMLIYNPGSL